MNITDSSPRTTSRRSLWAGRARRRGAVIALVVVTGATTLAAPTAGASVPPSKPVAAAAPADSARPGSATNERPSTDARGSTGRKDKVWAGYRIAKNGRADGGWIGGRQIGRMHVYRINPTSSASSSKYRKIRPIKDVAGAKRAPSARRTAQAAWVLSTYGNFRSDVQAAAVDAVVYDRLAGKKWKLTGKKSTRGMQRVRRAEFSSYVRRYTKTMLKRAAKFAGPYRHQLRATATTAGGNTNVKMRVLSAARKGVEGLKVTFTYDGTSVNAYTSRNGTATASLPAAMAGTSKLRARVSGLPTTKLIVRKPLRKKASPVAVAGANVALRDKVVVDVAGTQQITIANDQRSITTKQGVRGTWDLDGEGGARQATETLYGPYLNASAAGCTEKPLTAKTTTVDEDGQFVLSAPRQAEAGFYVWRVEVAANKSNQAASACGTPFVIKAVPKVAVNTKNDVRADSELTARVSISQLQTKNPLSASTTFVGPFSSKGDIACGSEKRVLQRFKDTIRDNGTFTTNPLTVDKPGWYAFSTTLSAGPYSVTSTSPCRAQAYVHVTK